MFTVPCLYSFARGRTAFILSNTARRRIPLLVQLTEMNCNKRVSTSGNANLLAAYSYIPQQSHRMGWKGPLKLLQSNLPCTVQKHQELEQVAQSPSLLVMVTGMEDLPSLWATWDGISPLAMQNISSFSPG